MVFAGSAFTCSAIPVLAADPADARSACEGATAALALFAEAGLRFETSGHIEVTDLVSAIASPSAAGCFLEREKRVLLLPYAKFARQKTWFNVAITRDLYRSAAAHEMGHALAACNFAVASPSMIAKEYVAYVTMFATMPQKLRDRILSTYPDEHETDTSNLSPALLMFDPSRFGVRAYLHFISQANNKAFLQAVFEGRALSE